MRLLLAGLAITSFGLLILLPVLSPAVCFFLCRLQPMPSSRKVAEGVNAIGEFLGVMQNSVVAEIISAIDDKRSAYQPQVCLACALSVFSSVIPCPLAFDPPSAPARSRLTYLSFATGLWSDQRPGPQAARWLSLPKVRCCPLSPHLATAVSL